MCQFFSAIATRDGRLLFTDADSHEEIIYRAKLCDDDLHIRHWVRLELKPYGDNWGSLKVDETSVPSWFDTDDWHHRMIALASRVKQARDAYDVVAKQALDVYDAAMKQARDAYGAAMKQMWAAYYVAAKQAWAAYDPAAKKARAAYIATISTIEGYVHERTTWSSY